MYNDSVYAVLNIPNGEYITLNNQIVLCEGLEIANHIVSIATGDISYYHGFPRASYKIGKISLLEYEFLPDILEFDIVSIPRNVLNEDALTHMITANHFICKLYAGVI